MENMHRFGLLLVAFVGIFTHVSYAALGDNCASEEGALCMANLHTLQMKDGGDVTKLSVAELVSRCAELRRNLACLLTHTQRCVALADKRDQHAKVILEARKYIAAVCEADESVKAHWKDSKCYRQASLQRCDREFQDLMHQQQQQHKAPSNPPTDAQCRTFHQYQACVQRTVASCSDDSENFVTLYLLDYGASLAWQCPGSPDDQGSGRHQANVIQTSGGGGSGSSGGSLGPLDPLGPQGPQESGGSQQGSGKIRCSANTIDDNPSTKGNNGDDYDKGDDDDDDNGDDRGDGGGDGGGCEGCGGAGGEVDAHNRHDGGDAQRSIVESLVPSNESRNSNNTTPTATTTRVQHSSTDNSSHITASPAGIDYPRRFQRLLYNDPNSRRRLGLGLRRRRRRTRNLSRSCDELLGANRTPAEWQAKDQAETALGQQQKPQATVHVAYARRPDPDHPTAESSAGDDDMMMMMPAYLDMAKSLPSSVDVSPIVSRRARDVADLDADSADGFESGVDKSDSPDSDSAAFSGNTGSTCVKLIRNDMRRCYNRYQRQESELKKQQSRIKSLNVASDAQEVDTKPKVCCAFGAYTHCLQTAVQTRCSQDREALVDTIIAQTSKLIGGHCEEYFYGSPKCSSGASGLHARSTMSTTSVNALCVTLLLAVATSLAVRTATL